MSSLFFGLNTARNALLAQTAALNVTAHNISNAETPGYSRQSVHLSSLEDAVRNTLRSGKSISIGAGVQATEVVRSRFSLYDSIYQIQNQNLNYSQKIEELMYQVEVLFDEPSDRGLSQTFNNFFNGWQEVANDPQNMAARQSLKSFGKELAGMMQRIYGQLVTMREDIDAEIATIPDRINEITNEIADLNVQIRVAESQNATANDLRDKRDYLVDELSEYVDVRSIEQKDGTYTILIGSKVVVEHESMNELSAVTKVDPTVNVKKTAIVLSEGIEYEAKSGRMGALINFRDDTLVDIMGKMDVLAENIIESVNYEHNYGYGLDGSSGYDFFNPQMNKAFSISLSLDVEDVRNIAVSGDGTVGDNANALRIYDVKDKRAIDNTFTLAEYYNSLISGIGIKGSEAKSGRINAELLTTQIDNAREGVKGVSIDDELIQMITTQRIYQGASRIVTVIDSLLEEVIRLK